MSSADLADMNKTGSLPQNARKAGVPLTPSAVEITKEEGRICFEDELLRRSLQSAMETSHGTSKLMPTGHYQIDENTGGFEKGFCWFIGGETSWGKSSSALMILDENMRVGCRPLIVSWEDDPKLYADRMLCRRANVDALRLKKHRKGFLRLTPEEIGRLIEVERQAAHVPIMLDARGKSVEKVAKQLAGMIRSEGVDLVMVDYLQAGDNERPQRDRRSQVNYLARTLVDTIKVHGAAGIIYSQLTEDEKKKFPNRDSLRESRDLAHMAEVVALGFTAKDEVKNAFGVTIATAGEKVMFVDKVKDGPPKMVYRMDWDPVTASFRPVKDPHRAFDDELARPLSGPPTLDPMDWDN